VTPDPNDVLTTAADTIAKADTLAEQGKPSAILANLGQAQATLAVALLLRDIHDHLLKDQP
jgi:hypothetical protein